VPGVAQGLPRAQSTARDAVGEKVAHDNVDSRADGGFALGKRRCRL